jgi:hypothetical protein
MRFSGLRITYSRPKSFQARGNVLTVNSKRPFSSGLSDHIMTQHHCLTNTGLVSIQRKGRDVNKADEMCREIHILSGVVPRIQQKQEP